jgi:hypothetical protein
LAIANYRAADSAARLWAILKTKGLKMICEISENRSFYVDDGASLEGKFGAGVPVACCGNYRFIGQAADVLFNELGLRTNKHAQKSDDCPYVLVAYGSTNNRPPNPQLVKAARAAIKALAIGLESSYLYKLDQ